MALSFLVFAKRGDKPINAWSLLLSLLVWLAKAQASPKCHFGRHLALLRCKADLEQSTGWMFGKETSNSEPAKGFVCSCLKLGLGTGWKGFWKCLLFLTAWNFEVSLEVGREKGTTKQSKLAVTAVMKTCDLHCRQASPKSSWITCHALLHISINQFFSLVSLISSVSLVWRRGRAHMQMLIFVFQPALN